MSSVEQAVADSLQMMSDRDLEFALNYQSLEPSMRQSMEREVGRRKYWGSKSQHTGFTSRDGSLAIPEVKQSWADRFKGVVEQEREWMDNILSTEIKFELDKEAIARLTSDAFNMGIKTMYYKRTPPAKVGLVPEPKGFTSVPELSDLVASWIKQCQSFNTFANLDAVIAADKDLQQVTSPLWMKGQQIGRSLRGATAAAGDQVAYFDTEATFDFNHYKNLLPSEMKEHIVDRDVEFTYPHQMRVVDYPGMLHNKAYDDLVSKMDAQLAWKSLRDIQPASTIITARAPDFTSSVMMGAASGIEPIRIAVQPMVKHVDHLPIHIKMDAAAELTGKMTFTMPKSREASAQSMKIDMNQLYGSFTQGTKKPSQEEDLADTMSLIFGTKE